MIIFSPQILGTLNFLSLTVVYPEEEGLVGDVINVVSVVSITSVDHNILISLILSSKSLRITGRLVVSRFVSVA